MKISKYCRCLLSTQAPNIKKRGPFIIIILFLYEKANQDLNEFVYKKYIFTPSEVKHIFV